MRAPPTGKLWSRDDPWDTPGNLRLCYEGCGQHESHYESVDVSCRRCRERRTSRGYFHTTLLFPFWVMLSTKPQVKTPWHKHARHSAEILLP